MRRRPFQFSRRRRVTLYAAFTLTAGTGAVWAAIMHLGRTEPDMALPVENRLLQAHLAGALLLLVAFGAALPQHAQKSWDSRINRLAGGAFIVAFAATVLTAYGLLAFVCDTRAIHWAHLAAGALMLVALVAHIALGRRSERARRRHEP